MKSTKLKFRKPKTIKVMTQTHKGNVDKEADAKRTAMKAGLRVSRTGRQYYERRANRTDVNPKNKL